MQYNNSCYRVISIHPKWAEKIYSGEKIFEIRRQQIKVNEKPTFFLIYETSPICKATGFMKIKKSHYDTNENIWELVKNNASLTEKEFYDYVSKPTASGKIPVNCCALEREFSYKFGKHHKFPFSNPPQSWRFLSRSERFEFNDLFYKGMQYIQ